MLITWWRKRTVSALRKIEFRSSWQHGGFFELAAICSGDDDHVDGGDDDGGDDDDHVGGNDGTNQGGRSCAGAQGAPAEKFGLGRKF